MTKRSVTHATFCLERVYDAAPARVFAAFATEEGKRAWFVGPGEEWDLIERQFDCRVGGRERLKARWKSGRVSCFDALYLDITPGERLIYVYEMESNDVKISVSLATVEMKPHGTGTRLIVTEQGAFLDGYDDAGSREHGTSILLDRVGASLVAEAVV